MKDKYKSGNFGAFHRIKYYARKSQRGKKSAETAVKKAVKQELSKVQEMKYFDLIISTTIDGRSATTITAYWPLSGNIPQGNTDITRSGDKVYMKSLTLRGVLYMNQNAVTGNELGWFRLIIFQWHPVVDSTVATLNAQLPPHQIIDFGAMDAGTTMDPSSFYFHDRAGQYTILYDKNYVGNGTRTGTNIPVNFTRNIHINVPLKKAQKQLRFLAGSSTTAANQIFCVIMSAQPTAVANPPTFNGISRIRFTDS